MDCGSAPPASAEGVSSSKIPAGFAMMGPQYKAVSEVSGKHQTQKMDCILLRMGKDGLPLLCKRWNSTKSPKEKAYMVADICRLFGPLAVKAKKPVSVLEPKSVAETASALLDLDTSHTKFKVEPFKKDGARFVKDSCASIQVL